MILAKTLENALRKRLVILFDGFARIVSEDASCPAAWINLSFELYFKKIWHLYGGINLLHLYNIDRIFCHKNFIRH